MQLMYWTNKKESVRLHLHIACEQPNILFDST